MLEEDDLSSLGSVDFMKAGFAIGEDEQSIVSSVTGGGSMAYRGGKYVFEDVGEEGSAMGDISLVDGSIKSTVAFGKSDMESSR